MSHKTQLYDLQTNKKILWTFVLSYSQNFRNKLPTDVLVTVDVPGGEGGGLIEGW